MNLHAYKIWRAWLDGKRVQIHGSNFFDDGESWFDADPSLFPPRDQPHNCPDRWRIKARHYYRVFYNSASDQPSVMTCVEGDGTAERIERDIKNGLTFFSYWITDWTEYEKEEERE